MSAFGGHVRVSHLAQGMDSGVGARCPMDPHWGLGQMGQSLFQAILNRAVCTARLDLPAGKVGALIGQGYP